MSIGDHIRAWRLSRNQTVAALAEQAGLPPDSLEAIEAGDTDLPVSMLEALAAALGVPAAWLFGDPQQLDLLLAEPDGSLGEPPPADFVDPVAERVLRASRQHRGLYVLLTALLQSENETLIRAAEVSLRSLLKQARTAPLPWQNRRPGNFDPPAD
ncbi:helix-turn-helix domain-containing protein [Nitrospira sp. Kam-Ns4a]